MKPSARRLTAPSVLLLAGLLCAAPQPGAALERHGDVSPARAKELGITVRSRPSANQDVWVQVEFKTAGSLKNFKRADLELASGGKRLVGAALRPVEVAPDTLRIDFYIAPAALPDASVTVVAWSGERDGIGYRLPMKEFLPPAR
jgi:hypothetical protein